MRSRNLVTGSIAILLTMGATRPCGDRQPVLETPHVVLQHDVSRSDASSHASSVLEAVHATSGVPGLGAAVYVDGRSSWDEYLGVRDLETGARVDADTSFRIGSVSKAITAVVLARVWQRGGIDLDADVRRYVPAFPEKDGTVTARLLAGHLGGIRSYEEKDFEARRHIDHRHFPSTEEALTIFADDPLVASPGERYCYSVFGYTLLSAALEGATGRSFLSLLDREVLEPLGLRHTGADRGDAPGRATAYERTADGDASIAASVDLSYKWAGGGLYSTPRDLARIGSALLDPDFLSPAALESLTTSQRTIRGETTGVSLGWRVGVDSRERPFLHHAGSIAGGRAVVLLYPRHDVSVVITSNQALAPLTIEATAQVLAEPFLLEREGRSFARLRPVARFVYTWRDRKGDHSGSLRYAPRAEEDHIDLHPEFAAWAAGLGSPTNGAGSLLPMLVHGEGALIPVVTPAGAFGIDVRIGPDDTLTGEVVGDFPGAGDTFRAARIARAH